MIFSIVRSCSAQILKDNKNLTEQAERPSMIVEPNFPTKKKSRKRKDRTGKYNHKLSGIKNLINHIFQKNQAAFHRKLK